jgi:hypothetical protein
MDSNQPKKHYHLVTGEILFRDPKEETSGSVRLNTLTMSDTGLIRRKELGQAQQALQMHFFRRIQDETLQVLDVVILNISFLGCMTEEEFQYIPEGLELVEKAPEDIVPEVLKN